MTKKIIRIGDFFWANCLEGNTVVIINKSGKDIFVGKYQDVPLKLYDYVIAHMYINGSVLMIDVQY